MDPATLLTLLVAAVASMFMAWTIGAGSSGSTPFAPAVGANAISVMRAAFIVGILGLLGALVQGANVSETVGEGLVSGVALTPTSVIVGLFTAAGLISVGIFTGYPIATAFTVTGAMIGAGLALGGDPNWGTYQVIAAMWVLAPIVDGAVAYALARLLQRDDVPDGVSIPLLGAFVGLIVANIGLGFLGPEGASRSIAVSLSTTVPSHPTAARVAASVGLALLVTAMVAWIVRRDEARGLRLFLVGLGSLVAFSAGGSQVGLAVGPLLPLLDAVSLSPGAVLAGGGLGLLAGSWTGAPRMIKSISQDYSSLGPRRSISALIPSFVMAQAAVFLGVPISFNEIIVSAIIGSGMAVSGGDGVSRTKLLRTIAAWIGSFVVAFTVGYVALLVVG